MTAPESFARWDFHQSKEGDWIWQRVEPGGVVTRPSRHRSFGAAIADAMDHGFSPRTHQWLVEDPLSVTRFAPGEEPATLRI